MAAITEEHQEAQGSSAIRGYRVHDEQLRDVARFYRELYQMRRSILAVCDRGSSVMKRKNHPAAGKRTPLIRTRFHESVMVEEEPAGQLKPISGPNIPRSPFTAVRCLRCGIAFPVADFFYTQQSGLCIDCWEALVI